MQLQRSFLLAIYDNGEAINLNAIEKLPGVAIIAFIRCEYEKSTTSGQNEYYRHSVCNQNFETVITNSFQWKNFKCTIAKCDDWSQPTNNWSGNHNYEMRVSITIEGSNNEQYKINFLHWKHDGKAFKDLFGLLLRAEIIGLPEAIVEFLRK